MFKNIDLEYILSKYDILYSFKDMNELKIKDDIVKFPITLTGIIRNLSYNVINNIIEVKLNLYISYLDDCFDKHLECNYIFKRMYNRNNIEIKDTIFEFLKENENKKVLLQGLLDFTFYNIDCKNNEYYKIFFNIKNVSYTRYNLIMNKLQKQINLNYKKDINWNNINNIAVITDLSNDDAYIFKNNIDNRYNCLFFNLLIDRNVENNFNKTLNLISLINKEKNFDLIILLYNDISLNELYNFDTFNILKMIYYFNIPFCSIISYKNKHFNNEDLVLSKITSFDFINYDYALQVFNQIMKNKYSN